MGKKSFYCTLDDSKPAIVYHNPEMKRSDFVSLIDDILASIDPAEFGASLVPSQELKAEIAHFARHAKRVAFGTWLAQHGHERTLKCGCPLAEVTEHDSSYANRLQSLPFSSAFFTRFDGRMKRELGIPAAGIVTITEDTQTATAA